MKKTLLLILVILVAIQFIRPEKNTSKINKNSISTTMQIPEEVKQIIKTSCTNCHSNHTKYPWYNEIAPVSWFLASHVNNGKKHLNFSEWNTYNKNQKNHIIKDLQEVLKNQKMPLKSYLILHKDAKMTPKQYKTVLEWAKTLKATY